MEKTENLSWILVKRLSFPSFSHAYSYLTITIVGSDLFSHLGYAVLLHKEKSVVHANRRALFRDPHLLSMERSISFI